MGGGGSIHAMQQSYNFNRSQIIKHRKSFKEIAENYTFEGEPLDLKKASSLQIKQIRRIYEERRKKQFRQRMILLGAIVLLSMIGLYAVFRLDIHSYL